MDPLLSEGLVGVDPARKRVHRYKNVSASYHARTPQPNYSEFGNAKFVDRPHGRQYRIAKVTDRTIGLLGGANPRTSRSRILWVRLPIRKGGSRIDQPQQGERLKLYEVKTQRPATCVVDQTFFAPRAATGYVRVSSFAIAPNPAVDPSQWTQYLPGKGPSYRGRSTLP